MQVLPLEKAIASAECRLGRSHPQLTKARHALAIARQHQSLHRELAAMAARIQPRIDSASRRELSEMRDDLRRDLEKAKLYNISTEHVSSYIWLLERLAARIERREPEAGHTASSSRLGKAGRPQNFPGNSSDVEHDDDDDDYDDHHNYNSTYNHNYNHNSAQPSAAASPLTYPPLGTLPRGDSVVQWDTATWRNLEQMMQTMVDQVEMRLRSDLQMVERRVTDMLLVFSSPQVGGAACRSRGQSVTSAHNQDRPVTGNTNNNSSNNNNTNNTNNNSSNSNNNHRRTSETAGMPSGSNNRQNRDTANGRRRRERDEGSTNTSPPDWVPPDLALAGFLGPPEGRAGDLPHHYDLLELYHYMGLGNDHSDQEEDQLYSCSACGERPPSRIWKCSTCQSYYLCPTCRQALEHGSFIDHPRNHRFSRVRQPGQTHRHHRRRRLEELLEQHENVGRGGSTGSGNGRMSTSLRERHRGAVRMLLRLSEEEMIRQAILASTTALTGGSSSSQPAAPTRQELELRAAEVLSRLPRAIWGPAAPGEEERDEECCLCLDEYKDGEEVLLLNCRHVFHEGCLSPWLVKSLTCPMCKGDLSQAATKTKKGGDDDEEEQEEEEEGEEAVGLATSDGGTPSAQPDPDGPPIFFRQL